MSDAATYREFRLRSLSEHPQAFTSSFEEVAKQPLAATETRLADATCAKLWAAFSGTTMAGAVGLDREHRTNNRHKATLVAMYVAPEFSGRGIGCALVDTAVQDALDSGIELLVLTVTENNNGARMLYERAGFASFGVEPDAVRVNGISFGKRHMYLQLKKTQ